MNIDIGHIDKRVNSTKQTFTKTHTNVDVKLKEPTSVINPTFILRNTFGTNQYRFSSQTNYIYVPDWGYYWIMDIVYETNDIIKFVCARDVAATGKDYIKKINAYVKYCSDAAIATNRGLLDDDRFGPDLYLGSSYTNLYTTPVGSTESLCSKLLTHNFGEGVVILTTIGLNAGIQRWIMDVPGFVEVMLSIATEAAGASSLDQFTAKFFGSDWKECILGATYLPVKKSELDAIFSATDPVLAGAISVTTSAYHHTAVPSYGICNTFRRALPFIDICNKSNYSFLKGPKYTSVTFQYCGGTIDISNEALTDFSQVYVEESFDIITGDFSIKLYATNIDGIKGPMLGAIVDNLSADFSSALSYMPSTTDQGLNMLTSMYKSSLNAGASNLGVSMTPSSITSSVTETGPSEKISETAKGNYSIVSNAGSRTMSTTKNYDSKVDIGTGIIGSFTSMNVSPIGRNIGSKSCLATYFANTLDDRVATDLYRIVSSTNVPAVLYDEPTGPQTPTSAVIYEAFAKIYGWPCNKFVDLNNVRTDNYIQCIGANAGNVNAQDVTWTLTTYELTKLNEMLNTGIYLE